MRRRALGLVGLLYVLAWFLPVVKDGATLADGTLPGWEALRISFSPIWPGNFDGNALEAVLFVGSGLSNLVFVLAFVQLLRGGPLSAKIWSWILFAAAAIDSFWMIDGGDPSDLRAGYYAWFGSFVLLGLLARLSPAGPPAAA